MTNVKIIGLKKANQTLSKITRAASDGSSQKILRSQGRRARDVAKSLVQVHEGVTKDSIISVDHNTLTDSGVMIGPSLPKGKKAHWLEFGYSGVVRQPYKGRYEAGQRIRPDQPPRPFMRPMIDRMNRPISREYSRQYGNVIKRAAI